MRHLVIGQRQKTPNFSAFHWSPHGCLITIGQHFVTTRVVHLPKRTETSLITESDESRANHQLLQLCTVRTAWSDSDLCGPCVAAKAGFCFKVARTPYKPPLFLLRILATRDAHIRTRMFASGKSMRYLSVSRKIRVSTEGVTNLLKGLNPSET